MQYGHVVRKHAFVIFTASRFPYVYLCLNLMTVQTSKGKVSHSSKELVRRIMAFEYKKLLLLKSPQNKAAPNIVITEKNKLSQIYNLCQGNYKIKLLVLQMSHCSMWCSSCKNTSLDDDNDDHKYILMGILNILFMELILCIVSVS